MDPDSHYVEAIAEGKIVRVPETYARQEGLPILKKPRILQVKEKVASIAAEKAKNPLKLKKLSKDDLQRPLNWREDQVVSELVENFHWIVSKERRQRGMSRKRFAEMLGVSEESVKMLEYGILPAKDFKLVNRLQEVFGINLRKDKKDFTKSPREILEKNTGVQPNANSEMFGDSIELVDEF